MKKKCKVVMLSTKNKTRLHKSRGGEGTKIFTVRQPMETSGAMRPAVIGGIYQGGFHLYLISDDETKEGDWVIGPKTGLHKVDQCGTDCKKVIATTDSELKIDIEWGQKYMDQFPAISKDVPLPTFSEDFLKVYVKADGIDEVMVEYGDECGMMCKREQAHTICKQAYCQISKTLKLRDDKTVIISEAKVMFTKKELLEQLHNFSHFINDKNQETIIEGSIVERWAENNL